MTDPTVPTVDPPPPSWLRAAALVVLVLVIAADLVDGRLDASEWALVSGLGVSVWGPNAVAVIARAVRRGP